VEGLDVVLFVGNEHAWATERFYQGHYTVHLAIFVLILQNILGKRRLDVIVPNVSDVLLEAYFQASARLAYI